MSNGFFLIALALLPSLAHASGTTVATCSGSSASVTVTKDNGDFQVSINLPKEKATLTKTSSLSDLVDIADYPFNSQVRLALGDTFSNIDMRLAFKDGAMQLVVSKNDGDGISSTRAKLQCQVDAGFNSSLQDMLHQKTSGAM